MGTFIQWYMKFKTSLIKGLIRSKRQSAGLGNPLPMFTTNASESINALLKNKLDYSGLHGSCNLRDNSPVRMCINLGSKFRLGN